MNQIENRILVYLVAIVTFCLKLAVDYFRRQLPRLRFSVVAKHTLWDNALKGTRKGTSFLTN